MIVVIYVYADKTQLDYSLQNNEINRQNGETL